MTRLLPWKQGPSSKHLFWVDAQRVLSGVRTLLVLIRCFDDGEYAGQQQQLKLQLQAVLFPALDEMREDALAKNNFSRCNLVWQLRDSKQEA